MARVLIVEDDPGVREALRLYLQFEGYEARTASTGEEALQEVTPNGASWSCSTSCCPMWRGRRSSASSTAS